MIEDQITLTITKYGVGISGPIEAKLFCYLSQFFMKKYKYNLIDLAISSELGFSAFVTSKKLSKEFKEILGIKDELQQ